MNFFNQPKFFALLLVFLTSVSLSGCGLKGDLYQTPEQEPAPESSAEKQVFNTTLPMNTPFISFINYHAI